MKPTPPAEEKTGLEDWALVLYSPAKMVGFGPIFGWS